MKNIIFSILIISLIISCTSYNDDVRFKVQDYRTLTPENIQTNLKVANLVVDQEEYNNMYENYTEDIKIDALFSLYKNNESLIIDNAVRIKIKGGASSAYPLKSLGIKFDHTYDNSEYKLINPEILPYHSVKKIKSFRFRNSGNDFKDTMIKDMSYTKLAIDAGLNLDLMYGEQTIVFLNGAFLGIMNLRTEDNAHGIAKLYEVHKDDITLAKIIEGGEVVNKNGDFDKINRFIEAINQQDFSYVINEIDVDNFIDYMIYESYIGNNDWPKNNVRFFAINDGPFRFILFDLDQASSIDLNKTPFDFILNPIKNPITDMMILLYENPIFKQKYDNRFKELMNSNLLSYDKFNPIITNYKQNIEYLMPSHIEKYNYPETFTDWYLKLDKLNYNFKQREEYVKAFVNNL